MKEACLAVFLNYVSEPPAFMRLCHRYAISGKGPREKGAGGLENQVGKEVKEEEDDSRFAYGDEGRGGILILLLRFQGQFSGKKQVWFCGPRDSTNKKAPFNPRECIFGECLFSLLLTWDVFGTE